MTPKPPDPFAPPRQSSGSGSRFDQVFNGRPAPIPPGVAARVDITPESVQRAAQNFATGQQHLADAWMRLQTGLDANAGMAGTGAPARAFTTKYDPALKTIWKGFDAGIIRLGGTSKGLTQTANNHLKADHHSRADKRGSLTRYPFAQVYPTMSMAQPAPAMGQGGSGGVLAKLWPSADTGKLTAAASVWRTAAREIHAIGEWLHWTIGTITDTSSGPDINAMFGYFEKLWTPSGGGLLGALEDTCNTIADSCDQYAHHVNSTRTTMEWELAGAGVAVTITTAVGVIFTVATLGASDVGAEAADAAEIAAILTPTARELVASVTAMTLSLLSGDVIGALTIALSTIPTITLVETEVEEDLEPVLEDGMAATEGTAAEAEEFGTDLPRITVDRHGRLTNGKYTLDPKGMTRHVNGTPGKSQFAFHVNSGKATLDGAAYADKYNLWDGNKAKVPVSNGIVGYLGNGTPTRWINIYRRGTGYVHGSPGSPP